LCIEHAADHFEGQHYAYARSPWNVVHRRRVERIDDEHWRVTDDLLGDGEQEVALRWHTVDGDWRLDESERKVELFAADVDVAIAFDVPRTLALRVLRGVCDGDAVAGWQSEYYGEKGPRPTIELRGRVTLPVTLVTLVELGQRSGR
jgi:hypothetical protein